MKSDFLTIRLEPELKAALARQYDETGVRPAEFIRRTLRAALAGPRIETRDNAVAANLRRAGFIQPVLIPRREEPNGEA